MFKKARPVLRLLEGKTAGTLTGGAYTGVRETDKEPGTQLADFYNTLLKIAQSDPGDISLSFPTSDYSQVPNKIAVKEYCTEGPEPAQPTIQRHPPSG
ncbi:MAG: hypothetical protein NPIRA03_27810 [Nitrospirales bacterium]|nr:MAG: hypothetical protein NPIRA03_27810 [Nitrospirales bacterium]